MVSTKRVQLARARKAAGFTQERLAEALSVDRSTVGRWESGETEPQPWLQPRLAKLLDLARTELSTMLAVGGAPSSEPAARIGCLNEDEERHLSAALADARRYLDDEVIHHFHRRLDVCMRDDGTHGSARTLPAVLGILAAIEQTAHDVKLSLLGSLLSAGARAAEFAGWLYRDLRNPEQATAWYDRGTVWAQQARDSAVQGYILLKRSQMAYEDRDARRVLTLAQAAQYGPWDLPDHVRVEVIQQEARGLAMVGEPLPIIEHKLDEAQELFAAAQATDADGGRLSTYFDSGSLALRSASCYIEAGKPQKAAALFTDVLSGCHLSRRDRGYFLARLTYSLALMGEPDGAAGRGLEAALLSTVTASERTRRELVRSLSTLQPWQNRPGVRDLAELVVSR